MRETDLGIYEWAGKAERGTVAAVLRSGEDGWTLHLVDTYWNLYGSSVEPERVKKKAIPLMEAECTAENLVKVICKATGITVPEDELREKLEEEESCSVKL